MKNHSNWQKYIDLLETKQVPEVARRWYVYRVVPLPDCYVDELRRHIERIETQHAEDIAKGANGVYLPEALSRKYPSADKEFIWQYVFPASKLSSDPRSGALRRHHIH